MRFFFAIVQVDSSWPVQTCSLKHQLVTNRNWIIIHFKTTSPSVFVSNFERAVWLMWSSGWISVCLNDKQRYLAHGCEWDREKETEEVNQNQRWTCIYDKMPIVEAWVALIWTGHSNSCAQGFCFILSTPCSVLLGWLIGRSDRCCWWPNSERLAEFWSMMDTWQNTCLVGSFVAVALNTHIAHRRRCDCGMIADSLELTNLIS